MSGLPIEKQADMSLLLDEKVRDVVRKHLLLALEDPAFMDDRLLHSLASAILPKLIYQPTFMSGVKQIITNQMQR